MFPSLGSRGIMSRQIFQRVYFGSGLTQQSIVMNKLAHLALSCTWTRDQQEFLDRVRVALLATGLQLLNADLATESTYENSNKQLRSVEETAGGTFTIRAPVDRP